MPVRLLTPAAADEMIGKPRGTLSAWEAAKRPGRPPALRVGRATRYVETAILRWIVDNAEPLSATRTKAAKKPAKRSTMKRPAKKKGGRS